jgi:hypothetical protein
MKLSVLKKTHRSPQAGDVFVMLPPDNLWLYGRVISTEAKIGPMSGCVLVYIYCVRSERKDAIPELSKNQLLVPPIMTNNLPWRMGYFELLFHAELRSEDVLEQHCFRDLRGWYFDEANHRLPKPVEPVGDRGLDSYQTVDDKICKVLRS